MNWWMRVILFSILSYPSLSMATTYYIDITGGSDSNNGTSTATSWKHAPGMPTCTNTCASTTPGAGDRFIFKGGEIWPNANFAWAWSWSGTVGNRIYIGVDNTWYSGASWARPVLSGSSTQMASGNVFIRLTGDNVTIDDLEFTNFLSVSGLAFGNNTMIILLDADNTIIEHCYFHGVSVGNPIAYSRAITSSTAYPTIDSELIVRYNVFSGKDSTSVLADPNCTGACLADTAAVYGGAVYFIGNVCEYLVNCYVGNSLKEASHNTITRLRESSDGVQHPNAIESLGDYPGTGAKIHDNLIYAMEFAGVVTIWVQQQSTDTSYIWNNVIADVGQGNIINIGDTTPLVASCCGTVYVFNNTIECGPDANPSYSCVSLATGTGEADSIIKNNHFIVNSSAISGTGRSLTTGGNIIQTKTQASGEGMTISETPYIFSPQENSTSLRSAGENLTGLCASAGISCQDTSYGVGYDSAINRVVIFGRDQITRGVSGEWDVGAYEHVSGIRFSPTLNLRRVSWEGK